MRRRLLALPLLLIALAGCSAQAAPPAAAQAPKPITADDLFLDMVNRHGIEINPSDPKIQPGPAHTILRAHGVCDQLKAGYGWDSTMTLYERNDGLDEDHAALFIIASVSQYCPQYTSQIPR